ncbi:hypothetical protein AA0119_g7036 [Alternaria tenuissima]|uniref:Mid2 domain-containing protein n=1 Tax=Alternaria tenuissima TaxID=119927 RepID=A0ABY0G7M5_9PLEO|nr:hypothetical protein AA0119_g7036 [Alternaria tenuissima]
MYCTSCDVKKLDLWVTSFEDARYNFKIAGSIDITTDSSYQWDVNIPFAALVANDYWVLRFTPAGAPVGPDDPYPEQISSSGFYINGPPQPSTIINTVTAQLSSSSGSASASSTVPSNAMASATSSATATNTPLPQDSNSWNKTWIAGAVLGPIVGLALLAVLLWFLSKRRQMNDRMRYTGADSGQDEHPFQPTNLTYQDGKSEHTQTNAYPLQVFEMADDWHHQTESCGQSPAEMPGNTSEYGPSELYSGNRTSKP